MNQKSLSRRLMLIIIGVGICGLAFFFGIIPALGKTLLPFKGYGYWISLAIVWLSAIPCYLVLFFAIKISKNIGEDNSFCDQNALLLKKISNLAIIDSAYIFVCLSTLLILKPASLTLVLIALVAVFLGIAIAIASATLSHLVSKATVLQNDSDLTI